MCPVERERDRSCCRASGLTPELPVHVVLLPPLLVPLLLVPPLFLVPPLLRFQALVPPLFRLQALGTNAGATSTASRLLFSGLHSEISSSPAMVVKKSSGFY